MTPLLVAIWWNLCASVGRPEPCSMCAQTVLQELQCKRRVTYLYGSFDNESDWERAKLSQAFGVYILPEVEVHDMQTEDEENIICTMTMLAGIGKDTFVRLLLHRPESLVVATKVGIPGDKCQVWNDISQMIFAESINVKGFATLLTNMMTLNTPELSSIQNVPDLAATAGPWVEVRTAPSLAMYGVGSASGTHPRFPFFGGGLFPRQVVIAAPVS